MKYLYLHGLGQKPDSWNRVIKETKYRKQLQFEFCRDVRRGKLLHIRNYIQHSHQNATRKNRRNCLMWAFSRSCFDPNYAIDHPDKIKALVLIYHNIKCHIESSEYVVSSYAEFGIQ